MIGIVLTIINTAFFAGTWYFLGRGSIYAKLIKELREALEVIGAQETMIQAYKMKYNTEKTEKMENKINIAEILRDMPKGTKLYSPLFGKCELEEVINDKEYQISVYIGGEQAFRTFTKDGCYFSNIEGSGCVLFPSSKMRCWSKFFKRGDIVYNPYSQMYAVFECWANDDYTEFNTTINYNDDHTFGEEEVCITNCFVKATDKQRVEFIEAAEKHYGGKYNPETLQVEPVKVAEPKCSFKPFDKVLVRYNEDSVWRCEFFSNYNTFNKRYPYVCLSGVYKYCIHYDGNQHLLGTDKSPE